MRAFLETYGVAIFTLVLMAILIAFASPIGRIVKTAINTQIENIDTITNERIQNPDRPEEPKTAQDYVYACLYNNGEFVLSANEIANKENVKRDFGKVELQNETPIWNENASDVLSVRFETAIKPTTCSYWFADMGNLTNIKNLENLYTDKSDSMKRMFYECGSLAHIDTTYFDTRNVTNMWGMFTRCKSLISVDVSRFETSKVQTFGGMFAGCEKLTTIDVSHFKTSNATSMRDMFGACQNLQNIDVKNFDTKNVTSMWHMFCHCHSLTSLDVSSFDTKNVWDMEQMFYQCIGLNELDLSSFNTSNVTSMKQIFANSTNLKTITVSSSWNTSKTDISKMFENCGVNHVSIK